MRIREILQESSGIKAISKQEAIDRGMFGPVYHGSQNIEAILKTGFDPDRSRPSTFNMESGFIRPGDTANGYAFTEYGHTGFPPPIHHLGFGVYFTASTNEAKKYNGNSLRGLREFYLDVQNIEEINFGSPNTMMNWWRNNGYDPAFEILDMHPHLAFKEWVRATDNLTNTLKSKWDGVYYKAKMGYGKRGLDSNQICVWDASKVFVVDPSLSSGLEIGAKVRHNQKLVHYPNRNDVIVTDYQVHTPNAAKYAGWRAVYKKPEDGEQLGVPLLRIPPPTMTGVIVDKRPIAPGYEQFHGSNKFFIVVKWKFGGTEHNYYETEIEPA